MQISKILNLGHRSKSKNHHHLTSIKEEESKEMSNSISPRYNLNAYTHRPTRENSQENANNQNFTQSIVYRDVIRDESVQGGQEQVIIINNRKFIKSKSPTKDHSLSKPTPHINQPNPQPLISQSIKVKILENRISQLHRSKQNQYIQLLKQNNRLEKELELEKARTKNIMKDSMITPIKKISENQELYFSQHQIRIGSMKKRIVDLENALEVAKCQKADCYKLGQGSNHENVANKKYGKPFESIINQRQLTNTQRVSQDFQNLEKKVEQGQKQLKNLKAQLQNQLSEIKRLKFQNLMKTDLVLQKQQHIQDLMNKNMQSQITLTKLRRQNADLLQVIQKLQQYLENQKNQHKIQNQYKIPIRYAESESIDVSAIRNEKLIDVSSGCSVLIKESYHPTKQKQQNCPQTKPTTRKHSSFQQSVVQEFEEMEIDSDLNCEQFWDEENMCNILQKMQHLTQNNDRILIENKELAGKVLQLSQANKKIQDTLQQASQNLHKKQLEIDGIKQQNQQLKKCLKQFECVNETALKTRLSEKLIELEYSDCTEKWQRKNCDKCKELIKLISKISSQAQKLDYGNSTF